jgi:hypothetical protein
MKRPYVFLCNNFVSAFNQVNLLYEIFFASAATGYFGAGLIRLN